MAQPHQPKTPKTDPLNGDLASRLLAHETKLEVPTVSAETLAKRAPCKECRGTGGIAPLNNEGDPVFEVCPRCKGTKHEPLVEVTAPYTCDYCHKPMLAQRLVDDTAGGQSNVCRECAPYEDGTFELIAAPNTMIVMGIKGCKLCGGDGWAYTTNTGLAMSKSLVPESELGRLEVVPCPSCNPHIMPKRVQSPTPAPEHTRATLAAIIDAARESVQSGYDTRTLAKWVADLANELLVQHGGQGITREQFDEIFGQKGQGNEPKKAK